MKCPVCGGDNKVVDCCSDSKAVYRRRNCLACGYQFFTTELNCLESERCFTIVKDEYWRERNRLRRSRGRKSSDTLNNRKESLNHA